MSKLELTLDRLIELAFAEDFGFGDLTTESCVPVDAVATGRVLAKQDMVVAGIHVFSRVFQKLDDQVIVTLETDDAVAVQAGTVLCTLTGPARSILTGERVALNFLMRLSGIATMTHNVLSALGKNSSTRLVDTRKTMPGWRLLEKAAVRAGGGHNHRFGLSDGILIKENHIMASGGIRVAVERARRHSHHLVRVEVEATNLDEVEESLACGADAVMLDNMDNETISRAMELVTAERMQSNRTVLVEASGNMTKARLVEMADLGVDIVSMGALTHSAPCADVSLRLDS